MPYQPWRWVLSCLVLDAPPWTVSGGTLANAVSCLGFDLDLFFNAASLFVIVTDRLVFLHLHKSGGTFVNEFLLRFFPDARQIGYHLPRTYLPDSARGLPIF